LRIALLAVCVLGSVRSGKAGVALLAAVVILLVASPTLRLPSESFPARVIRVVEAVLGGIAVGFTWAGIGQADSPFFVYLLAPAVAAGLTCGLIDAIIVSGFGAATFLVVGAVMHDLNDSRYVTSSGQFVVVAIAIGAVAAWARRLLRLQQAESQPLYGAAYRLLTQLRTVARQLPGTLDPMGVTGQLLDEVEGVVPYDRAGVFVRTAGGRLTPLSGGADSLAHWDVDLGQDTPFAEAWTTQQPQVVTGRAGHWLVAVPMTVGVRTSGLVALEGQGSDPPDAPTIARVEEVVGGAALRLETALLFDDVREIATTEERQRLAREIHDGIAQELVIVGYGVDNALAELPDDAHASRNALQELRGEVTRLISELRLSLFDLRTDVEPHGGLGAAITAYLRTVGTTSGFIVHITLNETSHRLPAGTEIELLRIVQEAVTNARKHSQAKNLWVTCDIDPPRAWIMVEDDGIGISGSGRHDSFGLGVMRERAARLHAHLQIRPRDGGGTAVEVRLAGASHRRTLPPTNVDGEVSRVDERAADR
jgi:signal transduction histidine kinase